MTFNCPSRKEVPLCLWLLDTMTTSGYSPEQLLEGSKREKSGSLALQVKLSPQFYLQMQ